MIVIAGLGNPGDKYKQTRHNVGFIAIEQLALKYGIEGHFESKFNAIVGKGKIKNHDTIIVQPMTYMNLSGEAIYKILHYYKVKPSELIVIYDDLSLELGRLRFRPSGSDGGHNGIKSIIHCLGGTKTFPRLKLGIGPQPKQIPSEAFVLQKFSAEEQKLLDKVVPASIEAIEFCIDEGLEKARNKFNGVDLR